MTASRIIDALKDALAYAKGDRSCGRLTLVVSPSHPYWSASEDEQKAMRNEVGADCVIKQEPVPTIGDLEPGQLDPFWKFPS